MWLKDGGFELVPLLLTTFKPVQIYCFVLLFLVKLNGNRSVTGVLRGFDPFMNLVIDEATEEVNAQQKNDIGMVVSK